MFHLEQTHIKLLLVEISKQHNIPLSNLDLIWNHLKKTMECTVVLKSGNRLGHVCGKQTKPDSTICKRHYNIQLKKEKKENEKKTHVEQVEEEEHKKEMKQKSKKQKKSKQVEPEEEEPEEKASEEKESEEKEPEEQESEEQESEEEEPEEPAELEEEPIKVNTSDSEEEEEKCKIICKGVVCGKRLLPNKNTCSFHETTQKEGELRLKKWGNYLIIRNTNVLFDPLTKMVTGYVENDTCVWDENKETREICFKFKLSFKI